MKGIGQGLKKNHVTSVPREYSAESFINIYVQNILNVSVKKFLHFFLIMKAIISQ